VVGRAHAHSRAPGPRAAAWTLSVGKPLPHSSMKNPGEQAGNVRFSLQHVRDFWLGARRCLSDWTARVALRASVQRRVGHYSQIPTAQRHPLQHQWSGRRHLHALVRLDSTELLDLRAARGTFIANAVRAESAIW